MTETKIEISELKTEDSDLVKELAKYIEDKTNAKVETGTAEITVKGEDKTASRVYLRVLLRKFIHSKDLKEKFRVTGGKDNALIVKEKKVYVEEEE
jgi:hypothetical protein